MSDIIWEDPPLAGGKWGSFTSALRANPGRWARWPEPLPNYAAASSLRRLPNIEVKVRRGSGGYDLYARYVPQGALNGKEGL